MNDDMKYNYGEMKHANPSLPNLKHNYISNHVNFTRNPHSVLLDFFLIRMPSQGRVNLPSGRIVLWSASALIHQGPDTLALGICLLVTPVNPLPW